MIWLLYFFTLITLLTVVLYLYSMRNKNYWKKRKVPHIEPKPFFGNFFDVYFLKQCIGDQLQEIYERFKDPFAGFFMCDQPCLIIRDPELCKSILVKDFAHFIDRTMTDNKEDDPMGSHILFIIKNPEWKEIRRKITPVFTSGKMKLMYQLMLESGADLLQYLNNAVEINNIIETRELAAKYTTDLITSTSFGINSNCFKDENAAFRVVSRRIFNWDSLYRGIETTAYFVAPNLVKLFKMKFIDQYSTNFLREVFWRTMRQREASNYVRNDLLDILIQMKKDEKVDDPYKLEGDRLVAQATQFFIAGYETTSSTISFTLYELALNKDVQNNLRREILECKAKNGSFSYDSLKQMNYLEMCIKETLRKYPVLPFLDRRCNREYKIPNTNVTLERGVPVYISTLGLHYDPEYYPEPNKYIPDRFSEENLSKTPAFTYLPFGEGPRNCIGARFGTLSSKSGIAHIISEYEVSVCEQTQKQMKFSPNGFLIAPINGLRLSFKKL